MKMRLVHDFGEVMTKVLQYLIETGRTVTASELTKELGEDLSRGSVWCCLDRLWSYGVVEKNYRRAFTIDRDKGKEYLEYISKGPLVIMQKRDRLSFRD